MMTNIFSRKALHISICEKTLHFLLKACSYADVLSHVTYEGHGKVCTGNVFVDKQDR